MAKRQGVVTWEPADVLRISAESTVCVRTIERALRGEPIRPSSKARIVRAARELKLKVPSLLATLLLCLGCSSSSQNLADGSGGAADGTAEVSSGGSAGAGPDGAIGGAAGFAGAGGEAGTPPACGGNAGGFLACEFNGCNVCTEKVSAYAKYFANHPACTPLATCLDGLYGACNDACPEPSEADK